MEAVEAELKVGGRFRAIVSVQRLPGFPLADQNEPAGICQSRGEDVAPAARLAASPTAKTLNSVASSARRPLIPNISAITITAMTRSFAHGRR
jgi:hypothetical protein